MEKHEPVFNGDNSIFAKIWRSMTGRELSTVPSFYQPASSRHRLEPGKLNALRKRRAKNKMARRTHQQQRAAKR